jgi:hypothetical protein
MNNTNNTRNSRNPNNNHELDLAFVENNSTIPFNAAIPMNSTYSTPNISVVEEQAEAMNITPINNVGNNGNHYLEELNELGPIEPVAMDGGRRKTKRGTKHSTKRSRRGTKRSTRYSKRTWRSRH